VITVRRPMQWHGSRRAVGEMKKRKRNREKRRENRKENRKENRPIGQKSRRELLPGSSETKTSHARSRHSKNRWISVTAVTVIMLFAAIAAVSCYEFPAPIQAQLDIRPEKHAKKGTLRAGEESEVAAGSFRVMLNQLPTIKAGSRDCNIEYENPEENHYSARISLYLKETGRLIGGTTRVDPGYYVENIRLKESLPVGEHPVTARIELFEEKRPAGEMSIAITLRIIENQEGETG